MSIPEIAIILGHRDISTTMQYAHINTDTITRKAADILNKGRNAVIVQNLASSDTG